MPAALTERKEMGDLCAWMTFATVSERVEKRSTSPVAGAADAEAAVGGEGLGGWGCAADAWERAGEGTGDGYAR